MMKQYRINKTTTFVEDNCSGNREKQQGDFNIISITE